MSSFSEFFLFAKKSAFEDRYSCPQKLTSIINVLGELI